jgi:hypothetical protein
MQDHGEATDQHVPDALIVEPAAEVYEVFEFRRT